MDEKKSGTSKTRRLFQLSICVLRLEASKGHLKWKVTELTRASTLSRSLLYRYLGSTKEQIFKSALDIFCEEFYGFGAGGKPTDIATKIREARELVQKFPEAVIFYQKWRSRDSELQKTFMTVEVKFQKKLKKLFPTMTAGDILGVHTFIHGLVTAPFLNPDDAEMLCREYLVRFSPRPPRRESLV